MPSPLVSLGVIGTGILMIVFADRTMGHHRDNLREGKEYLRTEKFEPRVWGLICHMEDEFSISADLERLNSMAVADDSNPQELVSRYSDELSTQITFTSDIRKLTSGIGESASAISELEDNYKDLPQHIQFIGVTIIGAALVWNIESHLFENGFISGAVTIIFWLIYVLLTLFILYNLIRFISKRKRLIHNAIQSEKM